MCKKCCCFCFLKDLLFLDLAVKLVCLKKIIYLTNQILIFCRIYFYYFISMHHFRCNIFDVKTPRLFFANFHLNKTLTNLWLVQSTLSLCPTKVVIYRNRNRYRNRYRNLKPKFWLP